MKRNLIYTVLITLASLGIQAQQEAMLSQYMFSGLFLNPAYAGTHDFTEFTALHRQQWLKFDGAPVTQVLSAEGKIRDTKTGFGGILAHDKIGVTYKTDLYGSYAYRLKVSEGSTLSLGLRGGVSYCRALLTQLTVWDEGDQAFANNLKSRYLPNAGVGAYWYSDKHYIGLSVPNLVNYTSEFMYNSSSSKAPTPRYIRHVYLTGGYVFPLGDNLSIKPSVLVKYVHNAPVQADLNASMLINKMFWVGVSYRTKDGVIGMIEYQPDNNWRIGYAYDQPLTQIRHYSYGSHEVMLSYMLRKKEGIKIKNPRLF